MEQSKIEQSFELRETENDLLDRVKAALDEAKAVLEQVGNTDSEEEPLAFITDYTRFYQMLDSCHCSYVFSGFWNREKNKCSSGVLKKHINTMSTGESIMAQFFLSVWLGSNQNFDLIEAASRLDRDNLGIIIRWLNDPFRP